MFYMIVLLVENFYLAPQQVEESVEYFASTKKVEKCDLTLQHLENLELVSDNGGWEVEKLTTLFKVGMGVGTNCNSTVRSITDTLHASLRFKEESNFVFTVCPV